MKITGIDLERLRLPLDPPFHAAWDPVPRTRFDATLVRVRTDEGVCGVASGDTMTGFDEFEHLFIGADPLALAAHARTLETISFHAGRYWPLEAALWDLAGRALGVPVSRLLGGALDRVAVYASWGELRSPGRRAEDARALIAAGFQAVKVRIARDRTAEGVSVVAAIRDAVGDALAILVDLNQWWRMPGDIEPGLGPPDARRVIDELAELGVLWVEEPLAGGDLD
ncbi:MAG: mandelate racemase/muconate lactonizing enzyme family protein, partial [Solirubrobacteraceae bacterium]